MLKQLHVVASTAISSGGEGLAALRYAQALSSASCMVTLLSRGMSSKVVAIPSSKGIFEQQ